MRMSVTTALSVPLCVFAFLFALTNGSADGAQRTLNSLIVLVPGPQQAVPQQAAPQRPARDQRPVPATGTGVIRGRVVDGVSGQPLIHASVRLGGRGGNQPTSVMTDASGTFSFTSLPSGRYSIYAAKPTYLAGGVPDNTHSLRGTDALTLAEGQVIENITVSLYHGGAITGQLIDAYGDPIDSASVQVVRVPGAKGPRSFTLWGANDVGEYRVGRLNPGTYYLLATPHVVNRFDGASESTALVPTYYPGVLTVDQAQPIVVGRGQTLTGIDFPVLEQAVTTVNGIAMDGTGQPATGGNVSAQGGAGAVGAPRDTSPVRGDGTFELKLPPGDYRLTAYVRRRDPSRDASGAAAPAQFSDQMQMGTARITVGSDPLANVVINAGDGGTITGRILLDGDGAPPEPSRISIGAMPPARILTTQNEVVPVECRSKSTKVNADMTFTIDGVQGTCILGVNVSSPNWRARSATYHGADLLDRPVELTNNQNARGVQVVITTRQTDLAADVTDDQGSASQDYVLLAFSTDKGRWPIQRYIGVTALTSPSPSYPARTITTAMGPNSFTSTATMPTSIGDAMMNASTGGSQPRRGIKSLPAGEYFVVALDDASYEDSRDPAFLEQLAATATRVTLREGEPQTVQLRRIKAPTSAQ